MIKKFRMQLETGMGSALDLLDLVEEEFQDLRQPSHKLCTSTGMDMSKKTREQVSKVASDAQNHLRQHSETKNIRYLGW